ncbi:hypothetical protein MUK42_16405, partial [Musa troglodytarum]
VIERKVSHHLERRGQEVTEIAELEDEQIEYIKEKVTEEGRQEDLKKDKAPEHGRNDEENPNIEVESSSLLQPHW